MSDSQLIDELGGAAAVAELLGYDKRRGGVQRVHNWRTRGIPAAAKVLRPDLFMRPKEQPALPALPVSDARIAEPESYHAA